MQRVGIREVAKECGVSVATVSRALNGHPKVPPIRRRAVEDAAAKLGYRPNPLLSALMVARRKRAGTAHQGLAIVDFHREFSSAPVGRGIARRATEAGWTVDVFRAARSGMPLSRLYGILAARGIRCAVFGPARETPESDGFDWRAFSICAIGAAWAGLRLHTVMPDYGQGMTSAVGALAGRSFRRPGLVISRAGLATGGCALLDGFTNAVLRIGLPPLEPLVAEKLDQTRFHAWQQRRKPDCLITDIPAAAGWARTPLPHVLLENNASVDAPYLDGRPGEVGALAAEIAMAGALRNELGIPEIKRTVLVEMRLLNEEALRERA